MLLGKPIMKPIIKRRRKQKTRLAIKLAEIAHQTAPRQPISCARILRLAYNPAKSDRLLGIGSALGTVGAGVFGMNSDFGDETAELCAAKGRPPGG
jgi:hypothetical protein